MKTDLIKGFRDFTGEEAEKRAEIRKILIEIFEKYGFEPSETPIIEYQEFVKGGNQQDEVISDIFRLRDKGKRNLALRYEFTFQLKRLAKNKKRPYKRYQIGEVFRDEPVSANRFRQFTQCDADIIGSTIKDEAEILALADDVFNALDIKSTIYFNNRKFFEAFLDIYGLKNENKRKQVILAIDKLDKKSRKEVREELEKIDNELGMYFTQLITTIKNLDDFNKLKEYYEGICKNKRIDYGSTLFKKGEEEKNELEKYCKLYGIKLIYQWNIARGLSYYNGTVFEVKVQETKESIAGGGSYKINNIQSTGISFGLDRIFDLAKVKLEREKYLIWPNEKDKEAINIVKKFRKQRKICSLIYKTNMKKVFDYANSKKFNKVIFYDKKSNKFKVKNMKTGRETLLK